jgi:hypothetical protein
MKQQMHVRFVGGHGVDSQRCKGMWSASLGDESKSGNPKLEAAKFGWNLGGVDPRFTRRFTKLGKSRFDPAVMEIFLRQSLLRGGYVVIDESLETVQDLDGFRGKRQIYHGVLLSSVKEDRRRILHQAS